MHSASLLSVIKYTDGTQGESVTASVDDKLKIFRRLAAMDVDYIEAGWPGSNPKDVEFFERAKTQLTPCERTKLVSFGSTRRKKVQVSEDSQVKALVDSQAPTLCLVAKSHAWQVTDILQTTLEENIAMIKDTVRYLTLEHGRNVMVDLEHFFDGYRHNATYALECARAAAEAGATSLVLCDTNGGSMPWQVQETVQRVMEEWGHKVTIGIHCHNDCGMAVANSLTAAQHGVGLIQGTLNGMGERTGNADLCSVIPTLHLHMQSKITCGPQVQELTSLSRYVDELLNRTPNPSAPFVGSSAFAHKGGLHVAASK
jgi:2-isopropylmalate synthase